MTNKLEERFEDVPALQHIEAEGMEYEAKQDYADELVKQANEATATMYSLRSDAGYFSPEDLILLKDEEYHEHEFIHRLARRIDGEEPIDSEVPEEAERIVDEEMADIYGVPLSDTEAYIFDDYHDALGQLLAETGEKAFNAYVEEDDIVFEMDAGEFEEFNKSRVDLEEVVAHYFTDGLARNPIEMFFGYGIAPWNFRKASRSLERLDKDSDYDKGVMARRALGHDSIFELIETGEDLPEVGLRERGNLNGELWDESRTRLVLRSLKDLF